MNAKTEGWGRMDALIAEMGEEGVLALVMTRIAIGDDPREIALSMGMPWLVLRKWLEDKEERMKEWELAKRCFADGLAYEALREVRDCGLEEVPLARLRSEHYDKKAAKMSRVEWGDREDRASGFGAGGITIVIGSVAVPGKLGNVIEQAPEPMQENVKEKIREFEV